MLEPKISLFNLPNRSKTNISIIGIPFDSTQSVFTGSRFAPTVIRFASRALNEYSFLHRADVRNFSISDWGDLDVVFGDFDNTRKRLFKVLNSIGSKKYLFLGGDHSITIMTVQFFGDRIKKYVHLDADADFEDVYGGSKFSHGTVLRRVGESIGFDRVVLIGYRTGVEEELKDLEREGVEAYSAYEVFEDENILKSHLRNADYISLDLDVFDPAYAPEVGTPEPFGLDPRILVKNLLEIRAKYFDIVELTTTKMDSRTAILAAAISREVLISMAKNI